MSRTFKAASLVLFLTLGLQSAIAQETKIAFSIPESDLIPEGMTYDSQSGRFFVGSTNKRKIVEVDQNGKSRDFIDSGQGGMLGTVGMRVDTKRRILWALSGSSSGMPMVNFDPTTEGVSKVHKYNVDTRKLLHTYTVGNEDGRNLLNDLAVAENGDVYITGTRKKRIYRIENGSRELKLFHQLDQSMSPNGIDFSSNQQILFIAVYGGKNVIRLDLETKSSTAITLPPGEKISADGLYFYDNSLIAIQPWNKGRIVTRYFLNDDWNEVKSFVVLNADNSNFSQPTTGTIVNGSLYCIANSQLQLFSKKIRENLSIELKDPVILKIDLD